MNEPASSGIVWFDSLSDVTLAASGLLHTCGEAQDRLRRWYGFWAKKGLHRHFGTVLECRLL